jgi:sugar lactone lactonase YvrE
VGISSHRTARGEPVAFTAEAPWSVVGPGPEDITRGHDGLWYTGLDDGRILALNQDGTSRVVATTGGRPLGVRQLPDGSLIVADAFKGLLRVDQAGSVSVLVDSVNGRRMVYPDAVDLAPDGTIWMSDASARNPHPKGAEFDFLEARPTGRLLQYDPAIGRITVALDSLDFANGVALGPDGAYVLVNETLSSRITRLWLTGPRAGSRDVFIQHLPGIPDNLSYDGAGMFWVALYGERTAGDESRAQPLAGAATDPLSSAGAPATERGRENRLGTGDRYRRRDPVQPCRSKRCHGPHHQRHRGP